MMRELRVVRARRVRRHGSTTKTVLFGILAIVAAAVCVRLGIWQLDRLAQRRAKNTLVRSRGDSAAVSVRAIRTLDTAASHWRRVHVRGVADYSAELVHATRSQNGSPGVYLLTPVRPLDAGWGDTSIVVLRGFVAAPDGRTVDWGKAREADTLEFDALVTIFSPHPLGAVRMPSAARAVRYVDRDTLAVMMGRPLAPFALLQLGDTVVRDVSLATRIPPPSLGEGPHQSYAMQWFGFAAVFVVGFVAFVVSDRRKGLPTDI